LCLDIFAVTALAAALAEGKSNEEIVYLGTVFTQLGDTLATIASGNDLCENRGQDDMEL